MKRIYLLLLGLLVATAYAQIPQVSDPHCAYCDVNLKTGEAHKSSCPYYEAPKKNRRLRPVHRLLHLPAPRICVTIFRYPKCHQPSML